MNIVKIYNKTGKRGSLKWIIILIIAIIAALYFFDFSVQEAIEDEQTQSNFGYIRDNAVYFYDTYLRQYIEPLVAFLQSSLENILAGESSGIENLTPTIVTE